MFYIMVTYLIKLYKVEFVNSVNKNISFFVKIVWNFSQMSIVL